MEWSGVEWSGVGWMEHVTDEPAESACEHPADRTAKEGHAGSDAVHRADHREGTDA